MKEVVERLGFLFISCFLILATLAVTVNRSPAAMTVMERTVIPQSVVVQQQAIKESEVRCLAMNVYFESRGESYAGRLAVMWTTKNRVDSRGFPSSYCSTIHHRSVSDSEGVEVTTCAFSWTCDTLTQSINRKLYLEIEIMAREFLKGELGPDITSGATYFHNSSVRPSWTKRLERTVTIDQHTFYRSKSDS